MMQKIWFKAFIWFASTSFFFMAAAILISSLGPEASEQQTMLFMEGMMQAMENSLMGLSMSLESDSALKSLIGRSSAATVPMIFLGILFGLLVKLRRKKNAG